MDRYPTPPEPSDLKIETQDTIDVPQREWSSHALLRRAQLNIMGDGLEWPSATFEQLPVLRQIALVVGGADRFARISREFNFDYFVDATTNDSDPAQPRGHVVDRKRYYTRVTANGFHVVGVFTAATIENRRRYFQWLTGTWVEIGLSGFLYVRDDFDTHFSEVSGAQLDETQPGATTTAMTDDAEWTVETVQNKFVGEAAAEPIVKPTENSMFEPVIEPLSVANFPTISPPTSENIVDIPTPRTAAAESALPETTPAPAPTTATAAAAEPPTIPRRSDISERQSSVGEPVEVIAAVQRGIAVALATFAHRRDVDLSGAATIDHIARVAEAFDATHEYVRHCGAWLHDVIDRSGLSEQDLLEAGILPEIVEVVSLLTKREDVDSAVWLAAIVANPDAREIKLHALTDNAAPWRLRKLDSVTRAKFEGELAHYLQLLKDA